MQPVESGCLLQPEGAGTVREVGLWPSPGGQR